jgi:hypothetical protein
MKITAAQLRQLIIEEVSSFLTEETEEQQRTTAIGQISGILSRLHNTNINAQDVLNSSKEKYENEVATQKPKSMSSDDMSTADPIGEVYSEKQRQWACAQEDSKFDEMCADTAISKKKKKKNK